MSEGGDSDWESAVEAVSEGVRALKPPSSGRIVAQDGSGLNPPTRSHTRSPADGGARVRSPSPLGEAATSSTALSNVGVDAEGAVVDVLVVGNVASYPDNGNDMQRWPALERACM